VIENGHPDGAMQSYIIGVPYNIRCGDYTKVFAQLSSESAFLLLRRGSAERNDYEN